jgi:hypothetical protein
MEKGRHTFTGLCTPQADDLANLVTGSAPGRDGHGRISGAARRLLPRVCPQEDSMITKLVGAATLFAAGSLMAGGSTVVAATPVGAFGSEAALNQAGDCGAKDAKPGAKDAAKTKDTKEAKGKAKDGGCGGGGGCGSADMKKDQKGKKEGSCGKDKKEGSCGKEKK